MLRILSFGAYQSKSKFLIKYKLGFFGFSPFIHESFLTLRRFYPVDTVEYLIKFAMASKVIVMRMAF